MNQLDRAWAGRKSHRGSAIEIRYGAAMTSITDAAACRRQRNDDAQRVASGRQCWRIGRLAAIRTKSAFVAASCQRSDVQVKQGNMFRSVQFSLVFFALGR
jgi:hypothetical protein